jgi:hypothetical protein
MFCTVALIGLMKCTLYGFQIKSKQTETPALIEFRLPTVAAALSGKGCLPVNMLYKTTPQDQTSAFLASYTLSEALKRTSGACNEHYALDFVAPHIKRTKTQ